MKNSINSKLVWTNVVIVIVSISILFLAVTLILTSYMRKSLESQLAIENTSAYRLAFISARETIDNNKDKVVQPRVTGNLINKPEVNSQDKPGAQAKIIENLTDSITLVYEKIDYSDEYTLNSISDDAFPEIDNDTIYGLISDVSLSESGVIQTSIENIDYLCTATITEGNGKKRIDMVVVSFISLDGLNGLVKKYLIVLIVTSILLIGIAITINTILAKRITRPLARVIGLTKKYANNDFNDKYVANTGDEIEVLSRAVSKMGISLRTNNSEKEKLYRQISHELKTPLTAIYGYAEGIKCNIYKDNSKALEIIMSESMRIKKLTEDIVMLSKLESQIESFNFKKQDINISIERAIKNIESIAILNDIDIIYQPNQLENVLIDDEKMYRALLNLLSNCIKYTKDTVEVKTHQRAKQTTVSISDNGNGFDDEAIKNISKGIAKEKSNGSGIGISIVREIVKMHGGKFMIQNKQDGHGAEFLIRLFK